MSAIQTLRRTIVPMIDHPQFGPVRATPCPRGGPWLWESLDLFETPRGKVDLTFEAAPDGPGADHRAQLAAIVIQLDSLMRTAVPMVSDELGDAGRGCDALVWRGAHLTGRDGEFALEFSFRNKPDSMITAHFEGAGPNLVEIED